METFSASLALYAGNSPVPGEFPAQRPVTRSFDVFFDLRPNKRLSKQSWGWWFETPSRSIWRHCNDKKPGRLIVDTISWKRFTLASKSSSLRIRLNAMWMYQFFYSHNSFPSPWACLTSLVYVTLRHGWVLQIHVNENTDPCFSFSGQS